MALYAVAMRNTDLNPREDTYIMFCEADDGDDAERQALEEHDGDEVMYVVIVPGSAGPF